MTVEQIPGIPAASGPQPVLVYTSMQAQSKVYDKYISRTSISTGIGQIVIGVLCIVFNIVELAVQSDTLGYVGHGIWCGVMFIVAGGFGIGAGKHRTKCKIIAYLVLCIISASLTIVFLSFGILGAVAAGLDTYYIRSCNHGSFIHYGFYPPCPDENNYRVALAMEVLLCISGFVEAILAIEGATNGCRSGICCVGCQGCCCVSDPPTDIPAGYLSNNGQLFYINQREPVPYVCLPQTAMSGSGAPPPPNVPIYTQFGLSVPPSQPSSTAEHASEYTEDFSVNDKTADDELPLWP